MSLVKTKKNPITGAIIVADVVLKPTEPASNHDLGELQHDILLLCRDALSPHKIPAAINFVSALGVAESGKLNRRNA